jgi:hypothetical protein
MLANQWDFEGNGEQIRVHRTELRVIDHFLENSIFIGFWLTNQVSHETEVRFGFSMLDNLLSVGPREKIRLSGSNAKSSELEARCYIYI